MSDSKFTSKSSSASVNLAGLDMADIFARARDASLSPVRRQGQGPLMLSLPIRRKRTVGVGTSTSSTTVGAGPAVAAGGPNESASFLNEVQATRLVQKLVNETNLDINNTSKVSSRVPLLYASDGSNVDLRQPGDSVSETSEVRPKAGESESSDVKKPGPSKPKC